MAAVDVTNERLRSDFQSVKSRSTFMLYTLFAKRVCIEGQSVLLHAEPVFAAVTDTIATGFSQDACLRWSIGSPSFALSISH
jgi:hypothetical protein